MNGKKDSSFEINISSNSKDKLPEMGKKSKEMEVTLKGWISNVWEFCKEDSNRVIFSLKVGLAVLLVSLLILIKAPYQVFGTSIIWSILTVAIMFEYTVGATFNRGFNRALGSLLAGVLAICVAELSLNAGRVAEPYVIAISIFFIGAVTSFMKLWPKFVPYEYGFRVILFTYCLITLSGYRIGSPIRTAMDRLYSIAIGGIVAVLVNILILPIWAGELLHKELVNSFNAVADALEECVRKYLEDDNSDHPEFSKVVWDEFPDEPAYQKCKSTLNSSATLESLANSAKWEPPHGRFRHFFYPWSEYVKVGAVLRYCAYEVMALHGVLHSEIQAPYNLRITFQAEIRDATTQAAELVRCLGKDVYSMKRTLKAILLKRVHISTERLQRAIDTHSYLLTSDAPEKPQHKLSQALSANLQDFSCHIAVLDNVTLPENSVSTQLRETQTETYHEIMRKQMRRLYSWPSREVDVFEEEGRFSTDFIPNLNALDSTRALSLATFTSLLIEFVARLDHLVQAVDELSKLAKFKNEV